MARRSARLVAALALLACATSARAESVEIPLTLDSTFLRTALLSQLYRGAGTTARLVGEASDCNTLVSSDPVVSFAPEAVRVRSALEARTGTLVSGACALATKTEGGVELLLAPRLEGGHAVGFLVLDSQLTAGSPLASFATGTLWDAVKEHVHPHFERWRIELQGPMDDLRATLPLLVGAGTQDAARVAAIADSVALVRVGASPVGLRVVLSADVPSQPGVAPPGPEPETPLTPEEYARFVASVRRFDGFLTFVVKRAGADAALSSDRQELLAILLDARRDMLDLLDPDRPRPAAGEDPVRTLFVDTWRRLAPVLRRVAGRAPGDHPWHWIGFVASGDALVALDRLGPRVGVELSTDGLRRLARSIAPGERTDPTVASDAVDAELRAIFGFGAPLELPPEEGATPGHDEAPPHGGSAPAAPSPGGPSSRAPKAADSVAFVAIEWLRIEPEPRAALDARLRNWVPRRNELGRYLPAMRDLLTRAAERVTAAKPGRAPETLRFRDLVLATAWKESCWRQYVRRRGRVEPLRSSVGALGVMQVHPRVWRGFYDVAALARDPGYNAEAGAEILLHYLVDLALARGEHQRGKGMEGALRATYAAYNGGPGHLRRWRRPGTPARLRRIDEAFWRHYQAVRAGRELEVASCFGA